MYLFLRQFNVQYNKSSHLSVSGVCSVVSVDRLLHVVRCRVFFFGGGALSFEYHIQRRAHSWRAVSVPAHWRYTALFLRFSTAASAHCATNCCDGMKFCVWREKWRSRRQVAVRKEEVFVLQTAWRKITLDSVLKSSYLPSVSPLACFCLSLVSAYFP